MFELNFTFETLEELIYFINNKFENQKIKKIDDRRGKSTKAFHELCKKYKTEHPTKTYRECLKQLSQEKKSNSDINESEFNKNNIENNSINEKDIEE